MRGKMNTELRARCIKLRKEERLSLREIAALTGASKGSLSVWLSAFPLSNSEKLAKRRLSRPRVFDKSPPFSVSDDVIKREANPRKQGDAGMGMAIGWFAVNGYTVCIPLTDSQQFDLVVEKHAGLEKVFVRTTTRLYRSGIFECGLKTVGGNKSQTKIRKFKPESIDLVFIVCGDGSMYLIPSQEIRSRCAVALGKRYLKFKIQ